VPLPEQEVRSKKDKCRACRGVVSDAMFVIRRSSLGELPTKTLKKKKLEVFDLLENLCVETYTRHDDLPDVYHEVCMDMWEADEEKMLEVLTQHANEEKVEEEERKAAASLCAQTFGYCAKKEM